MDKQKFLNACEVVAHEDRERASIGTLSEKTLHAVLKNYFEPFSDNHEIKIGGFVADIVGEFGVIEIQTRSFHKLRKKLESFLEVVTVTVVYPIAYTKWLIWLDGDTGEITKKRKSPKIGTPYEAFFELYKIKSLLAHKNLRFCIVMLDMEEYRNLDGWSKDKKKGSSRFERIPVNMVDEIYFNNISDYKKLIPNDLPEQFTVKDFKNATKLSLRSAGLALNILNHIGAAQRIDKKGNAFVYKISL